ncbi:MAG: helix-turn-helix domain-containing protein [Anaeroplasmataceae bacterium]|nr:helix-turn-helix domain-containing protein [Anaeroplasmataceae bacterium]
MNTKEIGEYIKARRTALGLTQKDIANKFNITFQAVSKWEMGETLPDTALLLELADLLKTTVDNVLNGGTIVAKKYKRICVSDVLKGFEAIETVKKCFGERSNFYQGMIEGINHKMNMDIEAHLSNPDHRQVMYAEVILQAIQFEHAYVDMDEIRQFFKNEKMVKFIEEYALKFS